MYIYIDGLIDCRRNDCIFIIICEKNSITTLSQLLIEFFNFQQKQAGIPTSPQHAQTRVVRDRIERSARPTARRGRLARLGRVDRGTGPLRHLLLDANPRGSVSA